MLQKGTSKRWAHRLVEVPWSFQRFVAVAAVYDVDVREDVGTDRWIEVRLATEVLDAAVVDAVSKRFRFQSRITN